MEVTIKIDRKGNEPGTLGWLCANAATIKIGDTKDGKAGAWLKDHEGKIITVLAIRGYWGSDAPGVDPHQIETARRKDDGISLGANREFTDAAWVVVKKLIAVAEELLQEPAELAESVSVSVA